MTAPRRGPIESFVLAPFTVLVWIGTFGWTFVLCAVMWLLTRFVPFRRYQHIVPNPQMGWVLHIPLCRVSIRRARDYDPSRTSVYVQNHVSMLDGYAGCAAIPAPFCGLENVAHLRIPGYGWMMKMASAIPVRERSPSEFRDLMRSFKQRAKDGIGILAFPEGHRTLDGKLRPFERGVFRLAKAAKLPVVPIGVRGLFEVLPKGTWLVRPFGHIQIHVWPQIEIEGLSNDELELVSARIHHMISVYVSRGETLTYEEASQRVGVAPPAAS